MGNQHIVITQPRRVAAISTAERVACELGSPMHSDTQSTQNKPNKPSKHSKNSKNTPNTPNSTTNTDTNTNTTVGLVGYQIRHDISTINEDTLRIKFATDGILLKEVRVRGCVYVCWGFVVVYVCMRIRGYW